ncbi:MAG: TetR/AcrR family transcriptional regulator [Anaerovibrio sp.]|uniref:TetR/AcrR family transcriptional regulator n=1 Tax=Anaerovibrio sp. TaxID=1872532 RepID=UPI0025D6CA70|nr:TetR/AcrR family transcriptional regulator [Anaerovibrio sp.]MCR5177231.1 TetR/AcrR family transcriptional regulator [Anaerovibrio sp.]
MRKKNDHKKNRILDATVRLMADKGINGASMSMIAKASGIPQATIYVYFHSKEELLKDLYRYVIKKNCEFLMKDFDINATVQECFKKFFWRMVEYYRLYPAEFQVYEQFMSSMISRDVGVENVTELFEPLYAFVIRGQREGLIKKELHPIVVLSYFSLLAANIEKGKLFWGNSADDLTYQIIFDASWDAVIVHDQK